jgi:hypothetical protein
MKKWTSRQAHIFHKPPHIFHVKPGHALNCARAEKRLAEIDAVTGVAYEDQDIRSPLALCALLFSRTAGTLSIRAPRQCVNAVEVAIMPCATFRTLAFQ